VGTTILEQTAVRRSWLQRAVQGPGAPWAVLGGVAIGIAWVAAVDPNEPGHYPVCPFLALTGLYCPGCGALRATHALAHGDLAAAAGLNLLFVLLLPVIAGSWVLWARRQTLGLPRRLLAPAWVIWTFLAVEVTFSVLRNLPWFVVLAP
jgi:hypothetical protein